VLLRLAWRKYITQSDIAWVPIVQRTDKLEQRFCPSIALTAAFRVLRRLRETTPRALAPALAAEPMPSSRYPFHKGEAEWTYRGKHA